MDDSFDPASELSLPPVPLLHFSHGTWSESLLSFSHEVLLGLVCVPVDPCWLIGRLTSGWNESLHVREDFFGSFLGHAAEEEAAFKTGSWALDLFVRLNWTGPEANVEQLLGSDLLIKIEQLGVAAMDHLLIANEPLIGKFKLIGLFWIAKILLVDFAGDYVHIPNMWWFAARCCRIHQSLLEHPVAFLGELIRSAYATTLNYFEATNAKAVGKFKACILTRLYVEAAMAELPFWGFVRCRALLVAAQKLSGLKTIMTGALGKKTRFQREAKSQLFLEADSAEGFASDEQEYFKALLLNFREDDQLELQNEYMLLIEKRRAQIREQRRARALSKHQEKLRKDQELKKQGIEAANEESIMVDTDDEMDTNFPGWRDSPDFDQNFPPNIPIQDEASMQIAKFQHSVLFNPLAALDEAIILGFCIEQSHRVPLADEICRENMLAQCERVLRYPRRHILQFNALYHRSLFEKRDKKLQFRAMLQLESLAGSLKSEYPSFQRRIADFYLTDQVQTPFIELQVTLASIFIANGYQRSALDIYERLERWESVVESYMAIGRRDDADALLKNLLVSNPTSPRLWCLLGEVWNSPEFFQKSWDFSNQTYSKAMRGLGEYHRSRENYADAVSCYSAALAINSMFPRIWYNQGCCATFINNFDVAIASFSRVVAIDPEHGEAWNNLATLHIQNGSYELAMNAVEQCAKLLHDNWKVWDNYLNAAMNVKKWNKAIHAFNRLCELLPEDGMDTCALALLMNAVLDAAETNPDTKYISQFASLLDKLSNRFTQNPFVWQIFSDFCLAIHKVDAAVEHRKKMLRCFQMDLHWEKCEKKFTKFVSCLQETFDFFNAHTLTVLENFHFLKLEVERSIARLQKSDFLQSLKMDPTKSVESSCEQLSNLLVQIKSLLKQGEPIRKEVLIDSMSIWQ